MHAQHVIVVFDRCIRRGQISAATLRKTIFFYDLIFIFVGMQSRNMNTRVHGELWKTSLPQWHIVT